MDKSGNEILKRRLEQIRASQFIKREPVEHIESRNERREHRYEEQMYTRRERLPNFDPLREQFLQRNLSAPDCIQNLDGNVQNNPRFDDDKLEGAFHRAQSIMTRLDDPHNNYQQFYAHVPQNINATHIPYDNHISPLYQNNMNSIYSFQATRDNVKDVMTENNPFQEIPFKVLSNAESIGANLKLIRDAVREKPKKPKLAEPSTSTATSSKILDNGGTSNSGQITQKEVSRYDKQTQTTKNTGSLSFEIPSDELEDLSDGKKRILLEFMEAFNIRDNRTTSSIKERLQHRMANSVSRKRQQSSSSYSFGPPI